MAIDYYGSFPCAVRQTLSDGDLLRMEKARNQARIVLESMRNDPRVDKSKPEGDWTFKAITLGPNGPQESEIRIADRLAEAAALQSLARHCEGCPSNVRGTDFGCGGAIRYPVSAQAERWLVAQLPADLNTPRGQLLLRALADFEFDGSNVDAARARTDLYELQAPVQRTWGGFFSRKTRITSSQILHMAVTLGSLQAAHARLLAYFMGYLDDSFAVVADPDRAPLPGDGPGVAEFKQFFLTVALAGSRSVPVFIDA